ncbi:hypothetical protein [Mucilaginibacter lappiensis]|uniref:Uncharacterized protein n=1 Tax=Mucilaginibacter lappiensis TaxID=354630 RepID=A0A841JKD1_9SPHI|nr:hypothetical protein [Mucilaginibacter lappiensis]MBB6131643.1 hypothetical protein [Mucilaginibacter lappiensis]
MMSSVEAWWVGLCALPFDGAQGDSPVFVHYFFPCHLMGYYSRKKAAQRSPVCGVNGQYPVIEIKNSDYTTVPDSGPKGEYNVSGLPLISEDNYSTVQNADSSGNLPFLPCLAFVGQHFFII